MNKQVITNTLKSLQKTMRKHSPAILTGIGIAGMVAWLRFRALIG